MTQRLFHHLIRLPLPWFERRKLSDVLLRFQSIDPIKELISNGLLTAVVDGLLGIATVTMMFVLAPTLAVVGLVSFLTYAVIRSLSVSVTRHYSIKNLMASIAEQGKKIETLRSIQTIKAMGGEVQREADWANKFSDSVSASQKNMIVNQIFVAIHKSLDSVTNVFVVFLGVRLVLSNHITVGLLLAYISYQNQFLSRSYALFDQMVSWRLLDMYTFRLADIVLQPQENRGNVGPSLVGQVEGRIEFKGVSFRYEAAETDVLRNITFEVKPGEFVAIVGASGVGKSTLLKLACGLYQPSRGEIHLDGQPLMSWGLGAVRNVVGVVMQDDTLLSGTIAENVAFFDDRIDIGRVWECLRLASIEDDVQRMPLRLESLIGEMGSSLSGGQRQRVLIARALYRRPRLLLLDEATSHLDTSREEKVNALLGSLELTRIVVAHRPETIALADRIFHVEKSEMRLNDKKSVNLPPISRPGEPRSSVSPS